MHRCEDLIDLFHQCFAAQYNTRLIKGGEEPLYLPANETQAYHALYFAHGFFSSALHECAHWLIAGEKRRQEIDFGYWYHPDGRNEKEQAQFFRVEVKPQALEWILSRAAAYPFQFSLDNLNGEAIDPTPFKKAVYQEVKNYCINGLSERAQKLRRALCQFYKTKNELTMHDFACP